jgi:predicted  nucleic acid-binding Zn-ribbon protein
MIFPRAQIDLLNERRSELERRINQMNRERESLSVNLDESTDRIMLLEKETRERESQVGSTVSLIALN